MCVMYCVTMKKRELYKERGFKLFHNHKKICWITICGVSFFSCKLMQANICIYNNVVDERKIQKSPSVTK